MKDIFKPIYNSLPIEFCSSIKITSPNSCNPFYVKDLPLFSIDKTIKSTNLLYREANNIQPIIPGDSVSLEQRIYFMKTGLWVTFDINEFNRIFVNYELGNINDYPCLSYKIRISTTYNWTHNKIINDAKIKAIEHNYNITIMISDIINVETFDSAIQDTYVDYVCLKSMNSDICSLPNLIKLCKNCRAGIEKDDKHYVDYIKQINMGSIITYKSKPKIIVEHSSGNFLDIIKLIGYGADYVILNNVLDNFNLWRSNKKLRLKNEYDLDIQTITEWTSSFKEKFKEFLFYRNKTDLKDFVGTLPLKVIN